MVGLWSLYARGAPTPSQDGRVGATMPATAMIRETTTTCGAHGQQIVIGHLIARSCSRCELRPHPSLCNVPFQGFAFNDGKLVPALSAATNPTFAPGPPVR